MCRQARHLLRTALEERQQNVPNYCPLGGILLFVLQVHVLPEQSVSHQANPNPTHPSLNPDTNQGSIKALPHLMLQLCM